MPKLSQLSARCLAALLLVMQGLAVPFIELEHISRVPFPASAQPDLIATLGEPANGLYGADNAATGYEPSSRAAHDELRCPICRFASSRPEPVSDRITIANIDSWERSAPLEDDVSSSLRVLLSPPARAPPVSIS